MTTDDTTLDLVFASAFRSYGSGHDAMATKTLHSWVRAQFIDAFPHIFPAPHLGMFRVGLRLWRLV